MFVREETPPNLDPLGTHPCYEACEHSSPERSQPSPIIRAAQRRKKDSQLHCSQYPEQNSAETESEKTKDP
mgnify:CR=1 FL=1